MTPRAPQAEGLNPTDLLDPTTVAVEITAIKGQMALLNQQVSQALSNVGSTLTAMQGDLREVQKDVREVMSQQHALADHSTGLERLGAAIEKFTHENEAWRRSHEGENRGVADRVTFWRGAVFVLTLLGGVVSTAVVYIVQDGFARDAAERARLERLIERNEADIRELQQARAVK